MFMWFYISSFHTISRNFKSHISNYLEPIASGWWEWIEGIECKLDAWIDGEEIEGNGVVDDNDVADPLPSPFDINPPEVEHDKDAPTNPLWPKLWLMWLNPKSTNVLKVKMTQFLIIRLLRWLIRLVDVC